MEISCLGSAIHIRSLVAFFSAENYNSGDLSWRSWLLIVNNLLFLIWSYSKFSCAKSTFTFFSHRGVLYVHTCHDKLTNFLFHSWPNLVKQGFWLFLSSNSSRERLIGGSCANNNHWTEIGMDSFTLGTMIIFFGCNIHCVWTVVWNCFVVWMCVFLILSLWLACRCIPVFCVLFHWN